MYGALGMSTPSLHRESTDSLMLYYMYLVQLPLWHILHADRYSMFRVKRGAH